MPSRSAKLSRPADHLRLVVPPAAGAAASATAVAAKGVAAGRPKAAAAAARSLGDWAWHGLGAGVATASAGFATYALVFSTGEVSPSGNFNLFARYDRLYQAPGARHGPSPDAGTASIPVPSPARTDVAKADAVDFTPTGSLGASPGPSGGDGKAAPKGRVRPGAEGRPLPNFTLRDVFDGKALVESRSSLSVVKPGSMLDGAGEVLSIERRGDRWVVLTSNGVIAGQRR